MFSNDNKIFLDYLNYFPFKLLADKNLSFQGSKEEISYFLEIAMKMIDDNLIHKDCRIS